MVCYWLELLIVNNYLDEVKRYYCICWCLLLLLLALMTSILIIIMSLIMISIIILIGLVISNNKCDGNIISDDDSLYGIIFKTWSDSIYKNNEKKCVWIVILWIVICCTLCNWW